MKENKRERYNRIYSSTAPWRCIKSNTISMLAGIGRNHPILRIPMMIVLFLFIFVYNAFLYMFIHLKMREKLARGLAILMTVVLTLSSIGVTSLAIGDGGDVTTDEITVVEESNGESDVTDVELSSSAFEEKGGISSDSTDGEPTESEQPTPEDESGAGTTEGFPEESSESTGNSESTEGGTTSEQSEQTPEDTENPIEISEGEETNPEILYDENEIPYILGEDGTPIYVDENGNPIGAVNEDETALEGEETSADNAEEVCICDASCVDGEINPECPVCSKEGAELDKVCKAHLAALEDAEEEKEIEEVEFDKETTVNGIKITVKAPAGVFPKDSTLEVEQIENEEDIAEIEEMVVDKKDEETPVNVATKVEASFSFNITIRNAEGEEIEPDTSKGDVQVTFENFGVEDVENDDTLELDVYHVNDELTEIEKVDTEVNAEEDVILVNPESFSIYTVVITSGVDKMTILNYYQGTSKAVSYFTIYNEDQLAQYKDLVNGRVNGTIPATNSISTILVNKDDADPLDGITGMGQATDMVVGDLNLSAKIMDDIDVTKPWTNISKLPADAKIDGDGYTITFEDAAIDSVEANEEYGPFIGDCKGRVTNLTIKYGGKTIKISGTGDDTKYASVSIRVDGEKAEIGQAITGAETMAISCDDGETFITLERTDDLSVYKTKLENLMNDPNEDPEEDPNEENPENDLDGKVYHIYYVYEDENETISAASLTAENNFQVELDYVSVKYDMAHANTYKKNADGTLSENVMEAVRVEKNSDGTYTALEDFDATIVAISGHEVPTQAKNVIIKVNGDTLTLDTDYTYTYNSTTRQGDIHVNRTKITGPMTVTVKADSREDSPRNIVKLVTLGGSVQDPGWEKDDDGTYTLEVYEDTVLPKSVVPIKGGDCSIEFGGWYSDSSRSGNEVTEHTYAEGETSVYYAKWVIKYREYQGEQVSYRYNSSWGSDWGGRLEIQGTPLDNYYSQISYGYCGFQEEYSFDTTNSHQILYNMNYEVGEDAFSQIGNSDIYVALIYTIEDGVVDVTYVFENRGKDYKGTLYFGVAGDVYVAGDDNAAISVDNYTEESNVRYMTMKSKNNRTFKLYLTDPSENRAFGIDNVYSFWYGYYGSTYSNVWNTYEGAYSGDSGLAFSWKIGEGIPSGGYVTRTTKMGLTVDKEEKSITATLNGEQGVFANGDGIYRLTSTNLSPLITVNKDGSVSAIQIDGSKQTVQAPKFAGYKFSHWSIGAAGGADCLNGNESKKFKDSIALFANWIPQPDKSVKNESRVQKVNGSNELIVPSELANIVIENTTLGVDTDKKIIKSGETYTESAGYASGFTGIMSMEGSDDRYLLPDDIEVTIIEPDGTKTLLTKGKGYEYELWNNRRKANIEIRKQYIKGNVVISTIGYELPPVSPTAIEVAATPNTIEYGDRAVFTAKAEGSKNHVSTYQWYIAPYYVNKELSPIYWDYANQNGIPIQNGTDVTLNFTIGNPTTKNSETYPVSGLTISGADKATLRISGLPKFEFGDEVNETYGIHLGGYHVYCVVTSTRKITGEKEDTKSAVVELEVVTGTYPVPDGLEGSAPSYYGKDDGSILIEKQTRPAMQYKKSTESTWHTVTSEQLGAGRIDNLTAGTYLFKYIGDANHSESAPTSVTVDNGKYIIVTYRATGCDDENLRTQLKHVTYGTNVSATTIGAAGDAAIQNPAKKGYTFKGWEPASINNIQANTTVDAAYESAVYSITLNNMDATTKGTETLYEKYSEGFYKESGCANRVSGTQGIVVPTKEGYVFQGYYTNENGGIIMINADGCLSENISPSMYLNNDGVLYAHWKSEPVTMSILDYVSDTTATTPIKGVAMKIVTADEKDVTEDETYDADTEYTITVMNPSSVGNTVYVYADGDVKKTYTDVEFKRNATTSKYESKITLTPSAIGGSHLVFAVANIQNEEEATKEEKEQKAKEEAQKLEYTIIYKEYTGSKDGGEFTGTFTSAAPEKGIQGIATVLPEAVKNGYSFGGWYEDARCFNQISSGEIPSTFVGTEKTVYAKWIANSYTINLVLNNGSISDAATVPTQYKHGEEDVALPAAEYVTRENYEFTGWYDNEALAGSAITKVDASQVGDVTYYAGWDILPQHTVTLTPDSADGKIYKLTPCDGYETTVYHGKDFAFTTSCASAYRIKAVKADGKVVAPDETGIYKISNIIEDITVTVNYELLVNTDDEEEKAVATIDLPDGTVGYFDTLQKAVDYAAKYGDNSVINIQKDLAGDDIDLIAGNPYTIDLNGHTAGDGTKMLIEDGATVSLKNSGDEVADAIDIENRGSLTNEVKLGEVLNYGSIINDGTVDSLTQGESENGEPSKFVNNGTVGSAKLESGYFVENASQGIPEGLTGHTTIMNGNEYYVDFEDAVKIANGSSDDSTILILNTVDNSRRTTPIEIGNENGKKITIDLNSYNISSGELTVDGDVSFINGKGSPTCISEISASIDNTGNLEIGDYVKLSGATDNKGDMQVDENAKVTGEIQNEGEPDKGTLNNDGTITGKITNEGDVTNNGDVQNVEQNGGSFDNNGDVKNVKETGGHFDNEDGNVEDEVVLDGGSYTGKDEDMPTGTAVKHEEGDGTTTYYGTVKDAIDDINDREPSETPVVLEVVSDQPDLGGSPVIIDSDMPVIIDMGGHTIGDGTDVIQIGDGTGNGQPVTFEGPGTINSPVNVKPDGELDIVDGEGSSGAGDITVKQPVTNEGTFDNEGTIEGKVTNTGNMTNEGTLNEVDQKGGTLTNEENATIKDLNQSGGQTDNKGAIEDLTQTGGQTTNEGVIKEAEVNGGGYSGEEPEDEKGIQGKVASIGEKPDIIYFGDLDSALEYAAEHAPATVKLIDDIEDEDIDFETSSENPVTIDLNGHKIDSDSTLKTEEGTKLNIVDNSSEGKGTVDAPITNNGTIDNDGTINGELTNNGTMDNEGIINGNVINEGDFDNGGTVGTVTQKDGTFTNEPSGKTGVVTETGGDVVNEGGTIEKVALTGGGFEDTDPNKDTPVDGGVAKIGDKVYGDLPSAIEDANKSTEESTTIELTGDATLPAEPATVIDNENGKDIVVDLNGHDISGGPITIGGAEGEEKVEFTDGTSEGTKGKVDSPITNNGNTVIDEGVTVDEPVNNNGNLDNAGTINGDITNGQGSTLDNDGTVTGSVDNNGGTVNNDGNITGNVDNTDGTVNNSSDATIGGNITNEGTGNVDNDGSVGGNVTNTGSGEVDNSGTITGNVSNTGTGTVKNDENAIIKGTVTNDGGTVDNDGKIEDGVVNKSGEFDNSGVIDGTVNQEGGTFNNEEGGNVDKIDQTGGTITNEGSVNEAKISGGKYENEGNGHTAAEDHTGANVIKTASDGTEKYYQTLQEALNDAQPGDTITLQNDIPASETGDKDVVVTKPGVTIDLNGHDIKSPAKITVAEGATDVVIDNSKPGTEEAPTGTITAQIINNGGLTIEENIDAESVTNNGTLDNDGDVTYIVNNEGATLSNDGDITGLNNKGNVTNNGDINNVTQEKGTLTNTENGKIDDVTQTGGSTVNNGKIETVDFKGGGYAGNEPENQKPEDKKPSDNSVVKVGDKYYADLESAIEDANKSDSDTTIELLDDVQLPDGTKIGNENGKNITIDLNGHDVEGTGSDDPQIEIAGSGNTTIKDSEGKGSVDADIKVDNGANLNIDDVTVDGDLDNDGTTVNNGTIEGNVDNDGNMTNNSDIMGNVDNGGAGTFNNAGEDSFIMGNVNNDGTMDNEGGINGTVNNKGSLDNEGIINSDVTNAGNGDLTNDGRIDGQLTNKDNATTENSGDIHQMSVTGGSVDNKGDVEKLLQTGGSVENEGQIDELDQKNGTLNNDGTIEEAKVADMSNYTGKLPENGIEGINAVVEYTDSEGNTREGYYPSVEDALKDMEEKGISNATVVPKDNPLVIDEDMTIPEGTTLVVPEGTTMEIKPGVTVDNKGTLDNNGTVDNKGTLGNEGTLDNDGTINNAENANISNDGNITNNGTLDNKGELDNNNSMTNKGNVSNEGTVTNTGSIDNDGDISNKSEGTLKNNGSLDNNGGSLNGAEGADGKITNNGQISGGSITGPLDNKPEGQITKPSKVSGEIDNEGKIEVTNKTDVSGADITNEEGSDYKVTVIPDPTPKKDDPPYYPPATPTPEEDVPVVIPSATPKATPTPVATPAPSTEPVNTQTGTTASPTPAVPAGTDNGNGAGGDTPGGNGTTNGDEGAHVDVLKNNEITPEEARELINSENPEDQETVKELIKEAVDSGNVVTTPPENVEELINLNGTNGEGDTSDASGEAAENTPLVVPVAINADDMEALIDEVLTDEEKIAVLSGETLTIFGTLSETTDEIAPEVKDEIEKTVPEGMKPASYMDFTVYKKIGDDIQEIEGRAEVWVTYPVPERYRNPDADADEIPEYVVMRVYTDENGVTHTELVSATQNGYELSFLADNDSRYILVASELALNKAAEETPEIGELTKNEENNEEDECTTHWWLLGTTALYFAALTALRNKKKAAKLGLAAANTAAAVTLTCLGDCSYDKFFLAGNLLSTIPALNIIKSKDGEGVVDIDKDIINKALYGAAGLGVATLLITSIASVAGNGVLDTTKTIGEDITPIMAEANEEVVEEPVVEVEPIEVEESVVEVEPIEVEEPVVEVEPIEVEPVDAEPAVEEAADETETDDESVEETEAANEEAESEDEAVEEAEATVDETVEEAETEEVEVETETEVEETETEEPATDENAEETAEEPEVLTAATSTEIEVASGMDSRGIANMLEDAGVIPSAKDFDWYLCINGYDTKMKVGHFEIPEGATEEEMAKILTKTM